MFKTVILLLFTVIWVCNADSKEAEKPYIDYLTSDYLSVEQSLWSRLNSPTDKNTLYSLIQHEHQKFIVNDFGVSTGTQDIYVPSGALASNLKLVNTLFYNTSRLLQSSSFDSIDIYFVHNILRNAVVYSENIFREAIHPEFWEKGKNYVEHCRGLETSPITVESEFQLIYNYYKDIRAALLKTYILTQLSHMLININNRATGNHISTQHYELKDELSHRVELIRRNVKNLLRIATRDSWVCDRFPYAHPTNYEQVTKFLQGYVDNELNFNLDDTCKNNCEDYTDTQHARCSDKTLCAQNRNTELVVCNGKIRDCQEIDSDAIEVCFSDNSTRRYHYLKYDDGKVNGKKPSTACSSINHITSWRRWFVKCSSCYCLCDEPKGSERHFSLHEVVSDVENNKIVTGVRLVKVNGVIQLSISERTLLPFGQTDASEQDTWKLATYQFAATDHGPIDGIDYFTLTYENRSINLDDLVVPQGKLVTGVRFYHLNGHLVLQIRATDFDYFNGRLANITYNPWVMNSNGGQNEVNIVKKINPIDVVVNDIYIPTNTENSFVRFGPSDVEFDVGQSTVPFIDTFPLESQNPVALGGVGLTYKHNDESGGFIAVKTITYDFAIADLSVDEEYDYID